LLIAFWTAIGLSFAAQLYISSSRLGWRVSWWYAVSYSLFDWYVFAVLSVPVIWLCRRYRLDRANWHTSVPLHLLASAAFSLVFMIARAWVAEAQGWFNNQPTRFGEAFQLLLVKSFHFNFLIYWVILAVAHAFNYYREGRPCKCNSIPISSSTHSTPFPPSCIKTLRRLTV
jgi:two-component system, LytTR family, sensor kinase